MFMRLLQLNVKVENISMFEDFYNKMVLPELHNMAGCLYATLIQSHLESTDFTSLTLWDSKEHAEAYERSEVFKKLLKRVEPYLTESAEWKIQLSGLMELEYVPTSKEPVSKEYTVISQTKSPLPAPESRSRLYTRLFTVILQEGKLDECKAIYEREIIPELEKTEGCLAACLIENIQNKNEVISLTFWNSREKADQYEKSGKFQKLVNKVKHTFSELFQWKMELEKSIRSTVKTSQDASLTKYDVVTGKRFD